MRLLLLTKDALCKSYLPMYGNQFWKGKTPNLDRLTENGTLFNHCITAAPSTVMSFRSIMKGTFAHEQPYDRYVPKELPESSSDFFVEADRLGYKCHIIWDEEWDRMVFRFGNCFGHNTRIHSLPGLRQGVGCHYNRKEPIANDPRKSEKAINCLIHEVEQICSDDSNILLWIHLPHVINGRTGYGTDIDLFDQILGRLIPFFDIDNIFVSADHGNMNGNNGKFGYGFDLHPSAIEIPLITPRLPDFGSTCNMFFSNVDFKDLILYRKAKQRAFVFSDCAYYAQPHRKLAIIHNGICYIYSKHKKQEELYDLLLDPNATTNLISDYVFDVDRRLYTALNEVYFHPSWDIIHKEKDILKDCFFDIWKTASFFVEQKEKALFVAKLWYHFFVKRLHSLEL